MGGDVLLTGAIGVIQLCWAEEFGSSTYGGEVRQRGARGIFDGKMATVSKVFLYEWVLLQVVEV